MSNRISSWTIPVKYRGMPMMVLGWVLLYLSTFVPFSWPHLITTSVMISAGPVMFFWGDKFVKKQSN